MLSCFPLRHPRSLLLAMALLAGCSTTAPVATETPAPAAARPTYSSATLADLLVAEVAAQRNVLGVTLGYYAREARAHQDPLVAEQAARLAAYVNDAELAVEMGRIWLQGEPDNQDAR